MAKTYTAIVLQGGGGLGAFEYGVLKALYEKSHFQPDIIVGVSIGAVAAAVVAGARETPLAGLAQLWQALSTPALPLVGDRWQWLAAWPHNAGLYQPNFDFLWAPFSTTGIYDLSPLRKTLEEIIDLERLNHPQSPQLVLTATNVATGLIEEFDNRQQLLTIDHILASGSLPPFFPMQKIDGESYWDGGMFSNTPLRPAVNRLEALGRPSDHRNLIFVELFSQAAPLPKNMMQVYNRMSQMFFSSKMSFDTAQFEKYHQFIELVYALNQSLPDDSPLRQMPGFKNLIRHRRIDHLHIIRNSEPASFSAGVDFSRDSVERRVLQGYEAAVDQYLSKKSADSR